MCSMNYDVVMCQLDSHENIPRFFSSGVTLFLAIFIFFFVFLSLSPSFSLVLSLSLSADGTVLLFACILHLVSDSVYERWPKTPLLCRTFYLMRCKFCAVHQVCFIFHVRPRLSWKSVRGMSVYVSKRCYFEWLAFILIFFFRDA